MVAPFSEIDFIASSIYNARLSLPGKVHNQVHTYLQKWVRLELELFIYLIKPKPKPKNIVGSSSARVY
jgi:hypothetical protein